METQLLLKIIGVLIVIDILLAFYIFYLNEKKETLTHELMEASQANKRNLIKGVFSFFS